MENYEEIINLIIIGDAFVGKTSLMKRFLDGVFPENTLGTVGVECFKKIISIKNVSYLVKIWDTCGQERMRSLTLNYYRNSDGIMLVFDVNEAESFDNLKGWVKSIEDNVTFNIPKVIVANKTDLDKRVASSRVKTFQKEHKVEVYESSAKSGLNVKEAFMFLINEVIKQKKEKRGTLTLSSIIEEKSSCLC